MTDLNMLLSCFREKMSVVEEFPENGTFPDEGRKREIETEMERDKKVFVRPLFGGM